MDKAAVDRWLEASWLGEDDPAGTSTRDAPGTYDATYRAVAVDGQVAVATGSSIFYRQPGGPVDRRFDNCFVMRFDEDGRCTEFTEWFMERPSTRRQGGAWSA